MQNWTVVRVFWVFFYDSKIKEMHMTDVVHLYLLYITKYNSFQMLNENLNEEKRICDTSVVTPRKRKVEQMMAACSVNVWTI